MSEYTRTPVQPFPDPGRCVKAETPAPVIVVGAVNIDISGTPERALIPGDSNPGHVTLTPGGVGRNIAENLRRLGRSVSMVTALGEDAYAAVVRESCRELGIDLSLSLTVPCGRTSTYLCVNEADGDLHAAVSDMTVCDRLTPQVMEPLTGVMNKAAAVILDANLPEETILYLAERLRVPVIADPVSVRKAGRLRKALPYLTMLKPNVPELELLTGMPAGTDAELREAAAALRRTGVRQVYVSLGSRGVYADNGDERLLLPCYPTRVINTNGCGDAFLAAAADGYLSGLDLNGCACRGLAAAAFCAGDPHAVRPGLSREMLEKIVKGVSLQ